MDGINNHNKTTVNSYKPSFRAKNISSPISTVHGVNPYVTAEDGKTILLPRFSSEEMQIARLMNKIAIRQAKNGIPNDYPNATVEDLKRLTDMTFEGCNKRTVYTNPETGEFFNLLHDGRTDDGLVKIRVLDEKGGFVKNVEVKPKKIIILDNFDEGAKPEYGTYTDQYLPMSHGHYVKVAAMRANPFADYECINIAKTRTMLDGDKLNKALADIQKRIDAGEDIEFLSFSFGRDIDIDNVNEVNEKLLKEYGITAEEAKATDFLLNCDEFWKGERQFFAQKNKDKVRIFQAAGNSGKNVIAFDLLYPNVEGVGALSADGKISKISSSRNSLYTQHYEVGVSRYSPTPYGLSFTNGRTTDVPLKPELQELAEKYLGKPPVKFTTEDRAMYGTLRKKARDEFEEQIELLTEKMTTSEEKARFEELKKAYHEAHTAKDKARMKEISDIRFAIRNKINDRVLSELKDYTSPAFEEYKKFILKIQDEGKLFSQFAGEYYLPSENPMSSYCKLEFVQDMNGNLVLGKPHTDSGALVGTSFSTPVRTAKTALHEMLKEQL